VEAGDKAKASWVGTYAKNAPNNDLVGAPNNVRSAAGTNYAVAGGFKCLHAYAEIRSNCMHHAGKPGNNTDAWCLQQYLSACAVAKQTVNCQTLLTTGAVRDPTVLPAPLPYVLPAVLSTVLPVLQPTLMLSMRSNVECTPCPAHTLVPVL
jgi:hypothetical protein